MPRIADDILLTHLEVALAVGPEPVLCGLNADDPRQQRTPGSISRGIWLSACAGS